jgi:hypothetical protein
MGFQVEDLDKADAWAASTLLDVGWHTVRIAEATDGTSSGGHPQVELRLESADGDIRDWLVYTPATKGKFVQVLQAAGIEPGEGKWTFPTQQLIGKEVGIKVGEEPDYNDPAKKRRRVQAYVPTDEMSSKPAPSGNGGAKADDDDIPFYACEVTTREEGGEQAERRRWPASPQRDAGHHVRSRTGVDEGLEHRAGLCRRAPGRGVRRHVEGLAKRAKPTGCGTWQQIDRRRRGTR